jgi:hypothetical protein
MRLEAIPVQFVALTDGVLGGEEHILLFLEHEGASQPYGFALTLGDGHALLTALQNILPEARQIQNQLREQN